MERSKIRARSKANTLQVLTFKQNLVDQRKKHNDRLTQREVAERMGVSQSTVAELERYDSNPTLRTLQRYANAVEALISFKVSDDCGEATFESITTPQGTASVQGSMPKRKPNHSYSRSSIEFTFRTETTSADPRVPTG